MFRVYREALGENADVAFGGEVPAYDLLQVKFAVGCEQRDRHFERSDF